MRSAREGGVVLFETDGVITRLVAMLAVALLLAGCGSLMPRPAVQLLTGDPSQVEGLGRSDACFMDMAEGPLTADPTYGTMIEIRHQEIIPRESPYPRLPVVWLPGFTGRWVGSEVEVLDPQGQVITITGHNYTIVGGGVSARTWPGLPVDLAWFACTPRPISQPLP